MSRQPRRRWAGSWRRPTAESRRRRIPPDAPDPAGVQGRSPRPGPDRPGRTRPRRSLEPAHPGRATRVPSPGPRSPAVAPCPDRRSRRAGEPAACRKLRRPSSYNGPPAEVRPRRPPPRRRTAGPRPRAALPLPPLAAKCAAPPRGRLQGGRTAATAAPPRSRGEPKPAPRPGARPPQVPCGALPPPRACPRTGGRFPRTLSQSRGRRAARPRGVPPPRRGGSPGATTPRAVDASGPRRVPPPLRDRSAMRRGERRGAP